MFEPSIVEVVYYENNSVNDIIDIEEDEDEDEEDEDEEDY